MTKRRSELLTKNEGRGHLTKQRLSPVQPDLVLRAQQALWPREHTHARAHTHTHTHCVCSHFQYKKTLNSGTLHTLAASLSPQRAHKNGNINWWWETKLKWTTLKWIRPDCCRFSSNIANISFFYVVSVHHAQKQATIQVVKSWKNDDLGVKSCHSPPSRCLVLLQASPQSDMPRTS